MAIGGTVSKPVWVKDGMYLSDTADADITIGNLVKLSATGVDVAGAGDDAIGVAVGGNRFSRTADDDVIESGQKVTFATRGIVNVLTDASAIVVGSYVKSGASGVAVLSAAGTGTMAVGIALEANSSAAATIQIKLLRG